MKATSNFVIVLLIVICAVTTTSAVIGNKLQKELKQAYNKLEDRYAQLYIRMLNEEWNNTDTLYFMED